MDKAAAKVAASGFDEISMVDGGLTSCPYKLPPLDGYSARTQNPAPRNDNAAPAPTVKTDKGSSDFHSILSDMKSSPRLPLPQPKENEAIDAGRQVESFLMALVFKYAFNTSLTSGAFGNSYESRMYLDMFIDAATEEACRTSGLGIAELVMTDISRRGEKQGAEDVNDATTELQRMR